MDIQSESGRSLQTTGSDKYLLIPLILFIALIPLVCFHKLDIHLFDGILTDYYWQAKQADFFSYYKSILIIASGMVSLLLAVVYAHLRKLNIDVIPRLLGLGFAGFAALILVSYCTALDHTIALWGGPERYEGLLVWMAYLLVALTTVFLVDNQQKYRLVLYWLGISASVAGLIGILQWLNWDIFEIRAVQLFLMPQGYWDIAAQTISADRQVYGTFLNPNNAGMYFAMLLPLATIMFLSAQKRISIPGWGFLTLLMWAGLVGSQARAALIAAFLVTATSFLIMNRMKALSSFRSLQRAVVMLALMALVFGYMDYYDDGRFSARISSILGHDSPSAAVAWQAGESVARDNPGTTVEIGAEQLYTGKYRGIQFCQYENSIELGEGESALTLVNKDGMVFVYDSSGQKVSSDMAEAGHVFYLKDELGTIVRINGYDMTVTYAGISFHLDLTGGLLLWSDPVSPELIDIQVEGPQIILADESGRQLILENNQGLQVFDENGQEMKLKDLAGGIAYIHDGPGYEDYLYYTSDGLLRMVKGGRSISFQWDGTQYWIVDSNGHKIPIYDYSLDALKGKERDLSSRVYIWSRSLSMVKQSIFLGLGADNYVLGFPQDDYLGKWLFLRNPRIIADKPHNLYLQIMINFGGLALIFFLLSMAALFKWSWKSLVRVPCWDRSAFLLLGTISAVASYLLSGFAYDSSVSISPVFWGIIGLSMALNHLIEVGTAGTADENLPVSEPDGP